MNQDTGETTPPTRSRILGTLRSADGTGSVQVQERYDTDIDDLWNALTDPARLARWIGEVEGDLRPGGEFRARFHTTGWEGTGRVEACDPPHHWRVRTQDDEEPGEHTMQVTLTAEGHQTVMVLEESGMPLDQLAAYGAGLQVHAEDLASYLRGAARRDTRERWSELYPSYQDLAARVERG